jgi:hypothetical protein
MQPGGDDESALQERLSLDLIDHAKATRRCPGIVAQVVGVCVALAVIGFASVVLAKPS